MITVVSLKACLFCQRMFEKLAFNVQLPKKGSAVKGKVILATSENNLTKMQLMFRQYCLEYRAKNPPLRSSSICSQHILKGWNTHYRNGRERKTDSRTVTDYGASSCSNRVRLLFSSSPSLSSLPDVSHPPWERHKDLISGLYIITYLINLLTKQTDKKRNK